MKDFWDVLKSSSIQWGRIRARGIGTLCVTLVLLVALVFGGAM